MMEIQLKDGYVVTFDDADYDLVKNYKWNLLKGAKASHSCYVTAYKFRNGKKNTISMHRLIMGIDDPKVMVDHKDRNGLNNCRSNLRLATSSSNQANRNAIPNKTSKYLGVSWHNTTNIINGKVLKYGGWVAQIRVDKRSKYLGKFQNEEDAARAYDKAAMEYHGEFANPNFRNYAELGS